MDLVERFASLPGVAFFEEVEWRVWEERVADQQNGCESNSANFQFVRSELNPPQKTN